MASGGTSGGISDLLKQFAPCGIAGAFHGRLSLRVIRDPGPVGEIAFISLKVTSSEYTSTKRTVDNSTKCYFFWALEQKRNPKSFQYTDELLLQEGLGPPIPKKGTVPVDGGLIGGAETCW